MKKFFAILCLSLMALLLVVGCGQKKEEPKTETMQEETTTMQDTTATMADSTATMEDTTAAPMEEGGH